jgi:hypothetical protein
MLCEQCKKALRPGALFCGKCGTKIPIKCAGCGTIREDEDDMFCIKCGKKLPESPLVGEEDEDASISPKAVTEPAPPAAVKQEKPAESPPAPPKAEAGKAWKLTAGKDLLEFYDVFSYKVGFVIEEEELVENTNFMLKAHQSKIIIWDDKRNGIKLEGFYKDGKRVSFWVNIQKNGSNDVQHQVGGKDEVVLKELDTIYSFMEYSNPKLITAIEKVHEKYCK